MFAKIRFAFFYWLMWIVLFEFSRMAFLIYNLSDTRTFSTGQLLQTFFYGLRMDVSMASYIVLPVCIFLIAAVFLKSFALPALYKIYTGIVLIPVLLIIFCDLPVFKAWGSRLNTMPVKYLASPNEAWASVSNLPVFWIGLFFLVSFLLLYKFFRRYIKANINSVKIVSNKLIGFLLLLIFTALQIIPIRGGLQLAPLNQSGVYFSKYNFLNLASINVTWNFMHSLTQHAASTENPFAYLDSIEAKSITDSLFSRHAGSSQIIDLTKTPRPNVIIIVWESGIEKGTHVTKNGREVMPRLNELKKEGIYFSNIYCSGDRTDKGIVAVLSGYPSQPTTSIIKIPAKAAKLPTLPRIYLDKKYSTSFYYGGELEFANMKSYLLESGFQDFVSKDDFDRSDQNSKWGAHDHIVKNKILADLSKKQGPFFITWLTLSSHEPFETPVSTVIKGTDDESLFFNSLHYTDSTIYDFVKECKMQSWWGNTIILITADHGHRLPQTGKQIDDFKIPLLLLGGALNTKGIEINKTGSQTDIAATLLSQTGIQQNPFVWSKDLFNNGAKPWAYFSFNNAFGFVQQDQYFIFDNVGKQVIEQNGPVTETDIKRGKAIQQESFADYLKK